MGTLREHLASSQKAIAREAAWYAKQYGVSYQEAVRDVTAEYAQGWYEEQEGRVYGDWDGR